jgi:hypothetical protein
MTHLMRLLPGVRPVSLTLFKAFKSHRRISFLRAKLLFFRIFSLFIVHIFLLLKTLIVSQVRFKVKDFAKTLAEQWSSKEKIMIKEREVKFTLLEVSIDPAFLIPHPNLQILSWFFKSFMNTVPYLIIAKYLP